MSIDMWAHIRRYMMNKRPATPTVTTKHIFEIRSIPSLTLVRTESVVAHEGREGDASRASSVNPVLELSFLRECSTTVGSEVAETDPGLSNGGPGTGAVGATLGCADRVEGAVLRRAEPVFVGGGELSSVPGSEVLLFGKGVNMTLDAPPPVVPALTLHSPFSSTTHVSDTRTTSGCAYVEGRDV